MNYLVAVGNRIRSFVDPERLPDLEADRLFNLYAVLTLAKGASVTGEDVHNAWVAWMLPINAKHESCVPYAELDNETIAADEPFVAAIHAVAREVTARADDAGG